jgi:hypothetical protein
MVQNTNGRATFHLSQNVADWQPGDTGPDQITFLERLPPYLMNESSNMRDRSYRMYGVSIFNQKMKHDPAWRHKYGPCLHASEILKDFAYIGVQQSRQTLLNHHNTWNEENNFVIDGRCRMPNIWLAQAMGPVTKGCVSELNTVYICLRRHKYEGDEAAQAGAWDSRLSNEHRLLAPVPRAVSNRAPPPPTHQSMTEIGDINTMITGLDDADMTPVPSKEPLALDNVTSKSVGEYYWSWDVWTSHLRENPPVCFYTGCDDDNRYTGDYLQIGIVTHVSKGQNNRSTAQVTLARKALYPQVRSEAYLKQLHLLDELELSVGTGRVWS